MLSNKELVEKYGCSYCCAIGACHVCHGRAAIEELKNQKEELLKALKLIAGATGQAYSRNGKVPVQTIARKALTNAERKG